MALLATELTREAQFNKRRSLLSRSTKRDPLLPALIIQCSILIIRSSIFFVRSHSFTANMADLKEIAKSIFLRTLSAIEPDSVIKERVRLEGETLTLGVEQIAINAYDEVVLIGMGKASLKMGVAVEAVFGERIKRGILVTDRRSHVYVRSEVVVAGHPLPDDNSLIAGEKIVSLMRSCGARSLIVFLISGGGSSL